MMQTISYLDTCCECEDGMDCKLNHPPYRLFEYKRELHPNEEIRCGYCLTINPNENVNEDDTCTHCGESVWWEIQIKVL